MATDKENNKVNEQQSATYTHQQEAIQRPEVGIQPEFSVHKKPKQYLYNSSVAPELSWEESAERDFAEWLLNLIGEDGIWGPWQYMVVQDPSELLNILDRNALAKWDCSLQIR